MAKIQNQTSDPFQESIDYLRKKIKYDQTSWSPMEKNHLISLLWFLTTLNQDNEKLKQRVKKLEEKTNGILP